MTITRLSTAIFVALVTGTLACATHPRGTSSHNLEGPRWMLAQIGGGSAAGTTSQGPAYLRFVPDSGRVEGFGSCNRIGGLYTHSSDQLTIGPLMSTRMACADNAISAQEQAFMSALSDTRRYVISNDTLRLLDSGAAVKAVLVIAH